MIEQLKSDVFGHISSGSLSGTKDGVEQIMSEENVSQMIARPALLYTCEELEKQMSLCLNECSFSLGEENLLSAVNYIVNIIKNHHLRTQFDDSDLCCREMLFSYHVACGEFKTGADYLCEVNVDSGLLKFTVEKKTDLLVRCAEAYLQDEESSCAETVLNRARIFINDVSDQADKEKRGAVAKDGENDSVSTSASSSQLLQLRYRVIRAKVDDANRKFVEAARQYYELSNVSSVSVPQQEKLELLGNAVTCGVLGQAGPQRSRVLGLLYKDDRLKDLAAMPKFSSHDSILVKMYTERLIKTSELAAFEESLSQHQKALTGDGRTTIVEKAVQEHNMQATSRIYDNITFVELASILRLDTHEAENVAAKMIAEHRLKGQIDQTLGVLQFHGASAVEPLQSWNERIREICNDVSDAYDKVVYIFPDLAD